MLSRLEARRPSSPNVESVPRGLRRRHGSDKLKTHDPSLSAALQNLSIQPKASVVMGDKKKKAVQDSTTDRSRNLEGPSKHALRKVQGHRRLRSLCKRQSSLIRTSNVVYSMGEGPEGTVPASSGLPVSIASQNTAHCRTSPESKEDPTPGIGSGCSTASSCAPWEVGDYRKIFAGHSGRDGYQENT
jgi:hypothetical protein